MKGQCVLKKGIICRRVECHQVRGLAWLREISMCVLLPHVEMDASTSSKIAAGFRLSSLHKFDSIPHHQGAS